MVLIYHVHILHGYSIGNCNASPDSKVHRANMGSNWSRQDPGGLHVGPMNIAIWVTTNEATLIIMKSYHMKPLIPDDMKQIKTRRNR